MSTPQYALYRLSPDDFDFTYSVSLVKQTAQTRTKSAV